ncbi:MAG: histidine triad nucleotide-binding protein [Nitrospirae bacterium]|nr:MAG: Histidine triad (HIT) protein [Leptospirillum sp. Group IV 'UBA BS']MCL4485805.1 histidine triad nucleotide-binding protein [Nitrospirota bacterium]MCL5285234.1 histidine triad nucleotide-binding protein [Nitrospirota bacterium]
MTSKSAPSSDCLFCRIVRGEIPSTPLGQSDDTLIIQDIAPQAPFHALVIPRRHAADIGEFMKGETAPSELSDLFSTALALVEDRGIDRKGYRLVVNTGRDGGQTVGHLHFHLLAGRPMGWPPG